MTAEELVGHVGSLEAAAEVVEAIDDEGLRRRRGWDLSGWRYELVPWGVRFVRRGLDGAESEVFVLASVRARSPLQEAGRGPGVWVVVSGRGTPRAGDSTFS